MNSTQEYSKQYYQKNKEKIKERAKNYYSNNKEIILTKVLAYSSTEEVKIKRKKYKSKYKKLNKHVERRYKLKSKYGLSPEDYDKLFIKQNGSCKICEKHQDSFKKKLCVDHDHKSGRVRGLLCDKCNLAIGHFNDDLNLILKAASYLKEV